MEVAKSEVIPLFSVPMGSVHNPQHEKIKEKLIHLFREKEESSKTDQHGIVKKSKQVFESSFDLFNWPDQSVQELQKFCWAQLYQFIGSLNQYDVNTLKRLHIACESWYHITRKGGYFGIHNHPMASWSGVYCVQAGEAVEAEPDSGALHFISPHISTTSFIDKSSSNLGGQFSRGNKVIHLARWAARIIPILVIT